MSPNGTESRLRDPDALFARLLEVQRDLDEASAARFNARLVLLLADRIADDRLVLQAIEEARQAGT